MAEPDGDPDARPDADVDGGRTTAPTVGTRHITAALETLTAMRAPVLRTLLGATRLDR